MAGSEPSVDYGPGSPVVPENGLEGQAQKTTDKRSEPRLPIFSILDSIDFSEHFIVIGDVGTGKSTVTPIHEYGLWKGKRQTLLMGSHSLKDSRQSGMPVRLARLVK